MAVSLFFVISGFALSVKPIRQIRGGMQQDLLNSLSSSVIRRPIRLYGPVIISSFIVLVLGRLGVFDSTWPFMAGIIDFGDHHYSLQFPGLWDDLYHWATRFITFFVAQVYHHSDPRGWWPHDQHMWTVPIEFQGALRLILTQLALARAHVRARLMLMFTLVILAICQDWWDMELFWGGMLLCELHMIYHAYNARHVDHAGIIGRASRHVLDDFAKTALHVLNAASALYLLSTPEWDTANTPGFKMLDAHAPSTMKLGWRFWVAIGAFQLVGGAAAASVRPPPLLPSRLSLASIFSASLSRYLGDISYALYCTHGLVNHTIGFPLFWLVFRVVGNGGGLRFVMAVFECLLSETVLAIWVADVFWRLVDKSSFRLARWIEEMLLK